MPSLKHVHRYIRGTLGRNKWPIFKCNLPDCSHYISAELVEGKYSICHRCGERFILNKSALTLAKPHCRKCTERKVNPQALRIADGILEDALDFLSSPETSEPEERNDNWSEFDDILFPTNTK